MPPEPGILPADAPERLRRAKLLALDVDGTLTDGRIVYDDRGGELQSFCVLDGFGLSMVRKAGVLLAWISGRGSAATERRARELGVGELVCQSGPKGAVLRGIQERHGIAPDATIAMGDDLFDLELAQRASFFAAPPGAHPDVLERADYVCRAAAGAGAARELCDHLLRALGAFPELPDGR